MNGRLLKTMLAAVAVMFSSFVSKAGDPLVSAAVAKEIIDSRGADPLAGIWRIGSDGATVAFLPEASAQSGFDIVILDSPDMSVIPGRKIGRAAATGKIGTYDATFQQLRSPGKKSVRCIITLGKDGRLSLDYYKQGYSVRLWRLLPYLFRFSVSRNDTRPASVDGAIRMYPPTGQGGPVML